VKTIMGLVAPSGGRVAVGGTDITGWPAHRVSRQGVAYVPEGRLIFPDLTVIENIKVGERPDTAWPLSRLLKLFPSLDERQGNRGSQLSGGEQQMLAIARGLFARPRIMLVDEPTEGLAPLLVQSLTGILREINRRGTTILLVEQTLEVALALSHRLYVMDQGRIQFEGTPDALRKDPTIQQRFLQL
jgi:branched-chain amino acid transport system ATP-binding protein